jgi:hypothetical protein
MKTMAEEDTNAEFLSRKEYASDKIITCGYTTAQINIASNNSIVQMLKDSDMFAAVSKQMIGIFTDLVEDRVNKNFHDNLAFLQRQGIIPVSKERFLDHERTVRVARGGTALLLQLGIHAVLYSLDFYGKKRDFEKLAESVAAGIAYLTGKYTLPAQNVLRKIYRANFIDFDDGKIKGIYQRYIGSEIGILPTPRDNDKVILRDIYTNILTAADLEDDTTFGRAHDLGQIYGFGSNEIEDIVSGCKSGTNI